MNTQFINLQFDRELLCPGRLCCQVETSQRAGVSRFWCVCVCVFLSFATEVFGHHRGKYWACCCQQHSIGVLSLASTNQTAASVEKVGYKFMGICFYQWATSRFFIKRKVSELLLMSLENVAAWSLTDTNSCKNAFVRSSRCTCWCSSPWQTSWPLRRWWWRLFWANMMWTGA